MTGPAESAPTGPQDAFEKTQRAVIAWRHRVDPQFERLVEAGIHALADRDCDLANGDTYDPADYDDKVRPVVAAVLEYASWTPQINDLMAEVDHG